MKTQTTSTLYAYWNHVRGKRIAPQRFEIEPSRIADVLSETFILEPVPPSDFRYRLAGTRICEIMGQEMRGLSFLDNWRDEDRLALRRHIDSVRKLGAITRAILEGKSIGGRMERFELLVLPLVHNGKSIERLLGAIAAIQPETWLGKDPIAEFRLIETELTYPADEVDLPDRVLTTQRSYEPPAILTNYRSARIVRQKSRQFRVYDGGRIDPREDI
jgi:hypothetical protein